MTSCDRRASISARPDADLSTLLGGDYVNRFSIQGRSYKVIPQVKRSRAPDGQISSPTCTSRAPTPPARRAERAAALTAAAGRRAARPAVDVRDAADDGGAAGAEEVPAAQRRPDPGRDPAARSAGPGARLPRERSQGDPAAGVHHRLRGRVAAAAHRRQQVPWHVPAVGRPDLPRARGAVREFPRSVHHPCRVGAAGGVRGAAVLVPGVDDAEHLQPGRA